MLFSNWAMGQMNYLMGDNPADWSYIVGFGSTTPGVGPEVGGTATAASHPHHGDAQGSLTNSQSDPATDRHILWGALVGGPSSTDQPDDVTTDFVLNEVAVDYNAAFVGALAGLQEYYGQSQAMTGFTPPAEPAGTPYYATAALNRQQPGHPAHRHGQQRGRRAAALRDRPERAGVLRHQLPVRAGPDHQRISTPVYYDAADQIDGRPTSISAPVQWGDANSCVYYVTVDWSGDQIGLPPSRAFEFGINAARARLQVLLEFRRLAEHDRPGRRDLRQRARPLHPGLRGREARLRAGAVHHRGRELRRRRRDGRRDTVGHRPVRDRHDRGRTSTISNQIQLVNTGTSAIPLSNLTIRYWFTEDGSQPLQYSCDYAPVGCANVAGSFAVVSPAVTGADHYLQIRFASGAGSLPPGASTGGIQNRIFQAATPR